MESFESIIRKLLESENYWTKQSYRVELTIEEKRLLGKPTMPRIELDLIAYQPEKDELLVLEVKSFLDTKGVDYRDLIDKSRRDHSKYKLFVYEDYRRIVLERLKCQLLSDGLINKSTKVKLGLAAGNIVNNQTDSLNKLFSENGWFLWTPKSIKQKLNKLSNHRYDDDVVTQLVKILNS